MNEQELRLIVRAAVQKHLATSVPGPGATVPGSVHGVQSPVQSPVQLVPETVAFGDHVSHARYMQLINSSGACLIEEHVSCDHCGYCKSHGH